MATGHFLPLAGPDDWAAHRDTITDQYIAQDKKLREVVDFMQSAHHFHATPKMYKSQFKKWGLQKNFRYDEVKALYATGQESSRSINGRPVDEEKLATYLRRLPARRRDGITNSGRTPVRKPGARNRSLLARPSMAAPAPATLERQLRLPDPLRCQTELVYFAGAHISGSLEQNLWPDVQKTLDISNEIGAWLNSLDIAGGLLDRRQHKDAFRVLGKCCADLEQVIHRREPMFFVYVLLHLTTLAVDYAEAAECVLRYACGLLCSGNSPVYHVIKCVMDNGVLRAGAIVMGFSEMYVRALGALAGVGETLAAEFEMSMAAVWYSLGLLDARTAIQNYRKASRKLASRGTQNLVVVTEAMLCYRTHDFGSARLLIEQVMRSATFFERPSDVHSVYCFLFRLDRNEGRAEQAMESGRRWVDWCRRAGRADWYIRALEEFGRYMRRIGKDAEADELRIDFDDAMDVLCGRVEELTVEDADPEMLNGVVEMSD